MVEDARKFLKETKRRRTELIGLIRIEQKMASFTKIA
jgi:hypothetical protein